MPTDIDSSKMSLIGLQSSAEQDLSSTAGIPSGPLAESSLISLIDSSMSSSVKDKLHSENGVLTSGHSKSGRTNRTTLSLIKCLRNITEHGIQLTPRMSEDY